MPDCIGFPFNLPVALQRPLAGFSGYIYVEHERFRQ